MTLEQAKHIVKDYYDEATGFERALVTLIEQLHAENQELRALIGQATRADISPMARQTGSNPLSSYYVVEERKPRLMWTWTVDNGVINSEPISSYLFHYFIRMPDSSDMSILTMREQTFTEKPHAITVIREIRNQFGLSLRDCKALWDARTESVK